MAEPLVIETGTRFLLDPRENISRRSSAPPSGERHCASPSWCMPLHASAISLGCRSASGRGRRPTTPGPRDLMVETGGRVQAARSTRTAEKSFAWRSSRSRACSSTRWRSSKNWPLASIIRVRPDASPARPSAMPGRTADRPAHQEMERSPVEHSRIGRYRRGESSARLPPVSRNVAPGPPVVREPHAKPARVGVTVIRARPARPLHCPSGWAFRSPGPASAPARPRRRSTSPRHAPVAGRAASMNSLNRSMSPLTRRSTKPSASPTFSIGPSGSTSSWSVDPRPVVAEAVERHDAGVAGRRRSTVQAIRSIGLLLGDLGSPRRFAGRRSRRSSRASCRRAGRPASRLP